MIYETSHLSIGHLEGCLHPGAKCIRQVIGEKIWVSLRDLEFIGIYVDLSLQNHRGAIWCNGERKRQKIRV